MKNSLLIFSFVVFTIPLVHAQNLSLSRKVFDTQFESFSSHQGEGQFDSYLAMNIPFGPVNKFFKQIVNRSRTPLMSRGEAHITVIGPLEYSNELSGYISMNEIDLIAKDYKIQESSFSIICLGSAQKFINGDFTQTYYLVVDSPALLKLRQNILKHIVSRGGSPTLFVPENYYPHITVGFIRSDLHDSDGVYKDISTCESDIEIE
jgi:hypothetical protein